MTHFKPIALLCLAICTLFSGCKEKDLDLKNVDATLGINMGLTLPIGTIKATVGDFLGDTSKLINKYLYVNEDGVLSLHGAWDFDQSFRTIDITSYPAHTTKKCYLGEQISTAEIWPGDKYEIEYPIQIFFDGVNEPDDNERIDSISVLRAVYTSNITPSSDLISQGFQWEWVEKIDVILKDGFHTNGSNRVNVYKKTRDHVENFGDDITLDLKNFNLCFIKDMTQKPSLENSLRSTEVVIKFYVSVPWSASKVVLTDQSYLEYGLKLDMFDYDAIWGSFKPSNKMFGDSVVDVASVWPMWDMIKQAKLPLSEPSIDLGITTSVAGQLRLQLNHLFAVSNETPNDTVYAMFGGHKLLKEEWWQDDQYIPIDKSTLGQTITNHIIFDHTPHRGDIDQLFAIRPDNVGYSFIFNMYDSINGQIRLSNSSNQVTMHAAVDVPFVFNEGLCLTYADTIKDINLSKFSLDSLLQSVEAIQGVQASEVQLYLGIENYLPFAVRGVFHFLDENYQPVMLTNDKGEQVPFRLTPTDTLQVNAPTYSAGSTISAAETKLIVGITEQHLEKIASVKNVIYEAQLDDEQLQENAKQIAGIFPTKVFETSYIKIRLAIAANLKATIDLNQLINNDTNKEN